MNESMPAYVVRNTERALERGSPARTGIALRGAKVIVLGIAYKRDVDDLRESPALTILSLLQQAGAHVAYHDPFFPTVGSGRHYDLNLTSTPLAELPNFDCAIIVTDHTTYDFASIVAASKLIIDTRNATSLIPMPEAAKIVRC